MKDGRIALEMVLVRFHPDSISHFQHVAADIQLEAINSTRKEYLRVSRTMKTRKEKKSIIVKCIYIHSYEHTRLLPWGMLINLFILF